MKCSSNSGSSSSSSKGVMEYIKECTKTNKRLCYTEGREWWDERDEMKVKEGIKSGYKIT